MAERATGGHWIGNHTYRTQRRSASGPDTAPPRSSAPKRLLDASAHRPPVPADGGGGRLDSRLFSPAALDR